MSKRTFLLFAVIFCGAVSSAWALYSVSNTGDWPKSWPQELEGCRKHATTLVGPEVEQRHYKIPFTKREEFEAAWPHFLKMKSKGAPIFLVRGPKTDFFDIKPAGLIVRSPPESKDKRAFSEVPVPGQSNPRTTWMNTTFIELVVDGEIVDLNRIALPADAPIIDERFQDEPQK